MGGLFGNDPQWTTLETRWKAVLADPGEDGRHAPLRRFHMYDCEHGTGEFSGYKRATRDRLIHRLRSIILDTGLHGYSMVVSDRDWRRLVTGDQLLAWGDGERFCVVHCIMKTLEWAEVESVESEVAFVFDDRAARRDSNHRVFSIYQHYAETTLPRPKLAGIRFINSDISVPLQAADMFVWESNRFGQKWLIHRQKTRPRPHFQRFLETNRFRLQCATHEAIRALVASIEPGSKNAETIAHMARFFNAASVDDPGGRD
jgi:hypothetical protein